MILALKGAYDGYDISIWMVILLGLEEEEMISLR